MATKQALPRCVVATPNSAAAFASTWRRLPSSRQPPSLCKQAGGVAVECARKQTTYATSFAGHAIVMVAASSIVAASIAARRAALTWRGNWQTRSRMLRRAARRTVALLGADSSSKAAVRSALLGPHGPEQASSLITEDQRVNRVWCRCEESAVPLTLVEAPGHVDFLPFVDIALRVCASCLMVMPFSASLDERGNPRSPCVELAAHWAQRIDLAKRPLGIVLAEPVGEQEAASAEEVSENFARTLAKLRRLGLRIAPLNVPVVDAATGKVGSVSMLDQSVTLPDACEPHRRELLRSLRSNGVAPPTLADAVLQSCREREFVPVVFLPASERQAALVDDNSGCGLVKELVERFLPSVNDMIGGSEAGCWHGVDPHTGAAVTVRPVASEPFAGVAFQTTYLHGGTQKAHDLLVVRGTLRAGQPLFNATTGRHMFFAERLEPGGGCPECEVTEALPGDVVRITWPSDLASPGSGGSLCCWCDPAAPVRMSILSHETYASLAGDHCTLAVNLDGFLGSQQGSILGALVRTVEEDQSLRIECLDTDKEVRLTALGAEQLRRLRRRLRSHWGVKLGLRPCRIPYRATVRRPFAMRISAGQGAGEFTAILRIKPLPLGSGIEVLVNELVWNRVGGDAGIEAFAKGVRQTCSRGLPLNWCEGKNRFRTAKIKLPLVDVEVEISSVEMSSCYARAPTPASLLAMGTRCVRQLVVRAAASDEGSSSQASPALRILEPLRRVVVQTPRSFARRVARDLVSKGGRVHSIRSLRPLLMSIEATVPHRSLRMYGKRLATLSRSTATLTTQEGGYAEVVDADISKIATCAADAAAAKSKRVCPLELWLADEFADKH